MVQLEDVSSAAPSESPGTVDRLRILWPFCLFFCYSDAAKTIT